MRVLLNNGRSVSVIVDDAKRHFGEIEVCLLALEGEPVFYEGPSRVTRVTREGRLLGELPRPDGIVLNGGTTPLQWAASGLGRDLGVPVWDLQRDRVFELLPGASISKAASLLERWLSHLNWVGNSTLTLEDQLEENQLQLETREFLEFLERRSNPAAS